MKKILLLGLLIDCMAVCLLFLFTANSFEIKERLEKLERFSASSSVYYDFIDEDIDCLLKKDGENFNDIYLAAQGKTREHLKGTKYEKLLPVREMLDTQIPECERSMERRGWITPYGPWQE